LNIDMEMYFTQGEKKNFLIKNGFEIEKVSYIEYDYSNYGKETASWKAYYEIAYLTKNRPDIVTKATHGLDVVFNRTLKEKLLML